MSPDQLDKLALKNWNNMYNCTGDSNSKGRWKILLEF